MNYSINTSNQQTQSDNQMNWNTQSLINNQSNTPTSTNQMNYLQFQNLFQPTIIPTYANCYKNTLSFSYPNTNYSHSSCFQNNQLSGQLNLNYLNNYNTHHYPNIQTNNYSIVDHSLVNQSMNISHFPNSQPSPIHSFGPNVIQPNINSNSISNIMHYVNLQSNQNFQIPNQTSVTTSFNGTQNSNFGFNINNENDNSYNLENSTPVNTNSVENINRGLSHVQENNNSNDTTNENAFRPDNNYYAKIKNVNNNEHNFVDLTNFVIMNEIPRLELKENDITKSNGVIEFKETKFQFYENNVRIETKYKNVYNVPRVFKYTCQKGTELLMVDGYSAEKNKGENYRCTKGKRHKCPVTYKVKDGVIEYRNGNVISHNHLPQLLEEIQSYRIKMEAIKKENQNKSAKEIANELYNMDSNKRHSTAEKIIRNEKGTTKKEMTFEDIEIEENQKINLIHYCSDFIIIGDRRLFHLMIESDQINCDGTFFVTPKPMFYQMYSIHATKDNSSFPILYCLMINKSKELYKKLFMEISRITRVDILNKKMTLLGDFEILNFDFFGKNVKKSSCFFHFCQNLYKFCMKHSKIEYQKRGEYYQLARSLMMLALVKKENVKKIFKHLNNKYKGKLNKTLLNYFKKNYITGRYKIENWNVRRLDAKTNNVVEAFHSSLKKLIKHPHPTTNELIKKLNEFINSNYINYIDIIQKKNTKRQNRKYIQKDLDTCKILMNEDDYAIDELLDKLINRAAIDEENYDELREDDDDELFENEEESGSEKTEDDGNDEMSESCDDENDSESEEYSENEEGNDEDEHFEYCDCDDGNNEENENTNESMDEEKHEEFEEDSFYTNDGEFERNINIREMTSIEKENMKIFEECIESENKMNEEEMVNDDYNDNGESINNVNENINEIKEKEENNDISEEQNDNREEQEEMKQNDEDSTEENSEWIDMEEIYRMRREEDRKYHDKGRKERRERMKIARKESLLKKEEKKKMKEKQKKEGNKGKEEKKPKKK